MLLKTHLPTQNYSHTKSQRSQSPPPPFILFISLPETLNSKPETIENHRGHRGNKESTEKKDNVA